MQNPTAKDKGPSINAVAGAFAGLLLAWIVALWPMPRAFFKESDTFWLIEIGRNILHHMRLPTSDPYSFTTQGTHWILYQWLSEVIFALANRFGLPGGVSVLGAIAVAMLFGMLLFRRSISRGANAIVAFIVTVMVFYATFPDIASLRPQLFSFVLFFLLQSILEDVWSAPLKLKSLKLLLFQVFLIALIWVNCHISFPLALLMLGIYLAAAAVRFVRHREAAEKSRLKTIAWMFMTFLATTLINPYGSTLWVCLIKVNNNYPTQEMQPLSWSSSPLYICVYCLMLASTFCLWKTAARPRLALAVVLFIIGYLHARLIMYFCLSSCPLVAEAVSAMLPNITRLEKINQLSEAIKVVAFKKYYPIALMAASVLIVFANPPTSRATIPQQAAEYLASHRVNGNIFCTENAGSYLIYRFQGTIKVFHDTRLDLYDAAFCRRYILAINGSGWKELFAEYKICEALVYKANRLNDLLEHDPDWQKVYQDEYFSVFDQVRSRAW